MSLVVRRELAIADESDPLFDVKKALVSLRRGMTVPERFATIDYLSDRLRSATEHDATYLAKWCSREFEKLVNVLRAGIDDVDGLLRLCHLFRWGEGGVERDIPFLDALLSRRLPIETVEKNPAAYPRLASFFHVLLLQTKWSASASADSKRLLAQRSLPLLRHLLGSSNYLRNRGAFFLAQALLVLEDWDGAASYLVDALLDENVLADQWQFISELIFGKGFRLLQKDLVALLLIDTRYLNPRFWTYIGKLLGMSDAGQRAAAFAKLLERRGTLTTELHPLLESQEKHLEGTLADLACSRL